jgi:hypothetical protein
MLRNLIAAGAAAMALVASVEGTAQENTRMGRAEVAAMFEAARKNASATWSIDGKCLWSYFFYDPDRQKLERAGAKLQEDGYRLVRVRGPMQAPMQAKAGVRFILHVEKAERHTVDTLQARNEQLYAFAAKQGLETYDGMDVGPLPGGKCDDEK